VGGDGCAVHRPDLVRLSAAGGKDMRVRFAPSPTGTLHVGGARTALYNYLMVGLVLGSQALPSPHVA
jgi:hypothetical protein